MPELSGTCAWLALDRHRAGRVAAALNLDMVGENQAKCGSTLLIEDPPCFSASFAEPLLQAIRHDAQDWIMSFSGAGHYSLARMARVPYSGGSDHAVLLRRLWRHSRPPQVELWQVAGIHLPVRVPGDFLGRSGNAFDPGRA
jgi:hypothetical protein